MFPILAVDFNLLVISGLLSDINKSGRRWLTKYLNKLNFKAFRPNIHIFSYKTFKTILIHRIPLKKWLIKRLTSNFVQSLSTQKTSLEELASVQTTSELHKNTNRIVVQYTGYTFRSHSDPESGKILILLIIQST